jgi:hypothetical protein
MSTLPLQSHTYGETLPVLQPEENHDLYRADISTETRLATCIAACRWVTR